MKAPHINPLERDRQRAIYDYLVLKYPHACVWRNETGGSFTKVSGKLIRRGHDIITPGVSDLMMLVPGTLYGFEVKRERNRAGEPMPLRPAQFRFKERFEHAGGRYIVATDIDDVEEALRPF